MKRVVVFHGMCDETQQIAGWFEVEEGVSAHPRFILLPNLNDETDEHWYQAPFQGARCIAGPRSNIAHYDMRPERRKLATAYGRRRDPVPVILHHGDEYGGISAAQDYYRKLEARDDVELFKV